MENQIRKIILINGKEDYSGLWEVCWDINTQLPNISKEVIFREIIKLLEEKKVELFFCKEPYGIMEKINTNNIYDILEQDRYWEEPSKNDISIRLLTSTLGEQEII